MPVDTIWAVEKARSSRSTCRTCHERISQGSLRWVKEMIEPKFGELDLYFHLDCLHYPQKTSLQFQFADIQGLDKLSKSDQGKVKKAFEKAKAEEHEHPRKEPKEPSTDMFHEAHDETQGKKRGKSGGGKPAKKAKLNPEALEKKYSEMSMDGLKDFLRLNKQLLLGSHQHLIQRCVDGELNGRFLPCHFCGKGQLMLEEDGKVKCHGYFDESISMRESCDFESTPDDKAVRRGKWLIPGQDDPEDATDPEHEMKPEEVDDRLKRVVDMVIKDLPKEDVKMDKLADAMVAAGRSLDIAFPETKATAVDEMKDAIRAHNKEDKDLLNAGGLYLAMKDMRVKHGLTGIRTAAAAAHVKPHYESRCAKNEWLADEIDKLANLEAEVKDGAHFQFKVRADKRAASQIRQCTEEIKSADQLKKMKLAHVGKGTITHVQELLSQGYMDRVKELETIINERKQTNT